MSTRLKYYIADLLKDLEEANCKEITVDLNLDRWGCVDEKGKHHLQFILKPGNKLKRPKTVHEEFSWYPPAPEKLRTSK